jgi:diguanylate cyclase (GGDEF)-like protein/PAS domain S-box-containing protein
MQLAPILLGSTLALATAAVVVLWRRVRALERATQLGAAAPLRPESSTVTTADWLALPVSGAQDALFDWDITADRVRFSTRWREMLGLTAQEVAASTDEWFSRVHPADRTQVQADVAAQTAGGSTRFASEHRLRHESGQWLTVQWSGTIVRDLTGRALRVAGSVRDLTAQRTVEEQARLEAFYDGLTGLPNRALAFDLLRRAITRTRRQGERRFATLLVDLDRFIRFSDALGHRAGDELLRAAARRLTTAIRPGDVIARLGNDVFLLILDDVQEASEAERVADRVQLVLRDPLTVLTHEIVVTASIGIALFEDGIDSPADYVRNAELAMQDAKAHGGARHVFYRDEMRADVRHRASLEHDLRNAIARNELVVWYQPIFSSHEEVTRLKGFEALVRWNHPQRGIIGPNEFIPMAEETGMIVPLGTWVIGEACRHMMALAPNSPSAPWVSVNIAARQLADGALVEIVQRALESSGLAPHRLRLEVTENVILEDEEMARTTLQALRANGSMILMDDFGTGHASLSYLHRLPIGSIKIDRYFVGRMDVSTECLEIVRSVVSLAKTLSMDVVAEGVEQEAQLNQLRAMGCQHVQGFFLSHPLPAGETHALLNPLSTPRSNAAVC